MANAGPQLRRQGITTKSMATPNNIKGGGNMCISCEVLYINGVKCHETGCPDAWKDYKRECDWCGTEFTPEYDGQQFCDDSCAEDYNS